MNQPSATRKERLLPLIETPKKIRLLFTFNVPPQDRRDPLHVLLPHSLHPEKDAVEGCLIVNPPQRKYKDLLKTLPLEVQSILRKVIDIETLKVKFGTYERRRALLQSFSHFLVDEAVNPSCLPILLGKAMVSKNRFPYPIHTLRKGDSTKLTEDLHDALTSTCVVLRGQRVLNVWVGIADFTPKQLADNIYKVTKTVVKECSRGWLDIESLVIEDESCTPHLLIYAHDFAEEASHLRQAKGGGARRPIEGGTNLSVSIHDKRDPLMSYPFESNTT